LDSPHRYFVKIIHLIYPVHIGSVSDREYGTLLANWTFYYLSSSKSWARPMWKLPIGEPPQRDSTPIPKSAYMPDIAALRIPEPVNCRRLMPESKCRVPGSYALQARMLLFPDQDLHDGILLPTRPH